jgi:hypothetical protein
LTFSRRLQEVVPEGFCGDPPSTWTTTETPGLLSEAVPCSVVGAVSWASGAGDVNATEGGVVSQRLPWQLFAPDVSRPGAAITPKDVAHTLTSRAMTDTILRAFGLEGDTVGMATPCVWGFTSSRGLSQ